MTDKTFKKWVGVIMAYYPLGYFNVDLFSENEELSTLHNKMPNQGIRKYIKLFYECIGVKGRWSEIIELFCGNNRLRLLMVWRTGSIVDNWCKHYCHLRWEVINNHIPSFIIRFSWGWGLMQHLFHLHQNVGINSPTTVMV